MFALSGLATALVDSIHGAGEHRFQATVHSESPLYYYLYNKRMSHAQRPGSIIMTRSYDRPRTIHSA